MKSLAWMSLLAVLSFPLLGDQRTVFSVAESSSIELEGSTTIGGWQCEGDHVGGELRIDAAWSVLSSLIDEFQQLPPGRISGSAVKLMKPPRFHFSLPVEGLECGNRRMERDLRDALRYPDFSTIRFQLEHLTWANLERSPGGVVSFRIYLNGELSLAGVSREIDIEMVVERTGPSSFVVNGTIPLRMTDFDVEPPVAMLGLIRARDELSVAFELHLIR